MLKEGSWSMEYSQILDISPTISEDTAVFPGDVAFRRNISMSFDAGHHLGLSDITTTLHIGAHADAPSHYGPNGIDISQRALKYYLGSCQVVKLVITRGARIMPADLSGVKIEAPRILFRTDSFPDPNSWNNDFNSLSPELIDFLADQKVITVGIDTPSVDPADSKQLESHAALLRRNDANLEGLTMSHVAPGLYFLSALPLKIAAADASPVRAVLLR